MTNEQTVLVAGATGNVGGGAAVALAMGVVSIVLGILGAANVGTQVTLLSIGLAALALEALQSE